MENVIEELIFCADLDLSSVWPLKLDAVSAQFYGIAFLAKLCTELRVCLRTLIIDYWSV